MYLCVCVCALTAESVSVMIELRKITFLALPKVIPTPLARTHNLDVQLGHDRRGGGDGRGLLGLSVLRASLGVGELLLVPHVRHVADVVVQRDLRAVLAHGLPKVRLVKEVRKGPVVVAAKDLLDVLVGPLVDPRHHHACGPGLDRVPHARQDEVADVAHAAKVVVAQEDDARRPLGLVARAPERPPHKGRVRVREVEGEVEVAGVGWARGDEGIAGGSSSGIGTAAAARAEAVDDQDLGHGGLPTECPDEQEQAEGQGHRELGPPHERQRGVEDHCACCQDLSLSGHNRGGASRNLTSCHWRRGRTSWLRD